MAGVMPVAVVAEKMEGAVRAMEMAAETARGAIAIVEEEVAAKAVRITAMAVRVGAGEEMAEAVVKAMEVPAAPARAVGAPTALAV